MSNIKSKIMIFFVVFSLIFNFNSKGYSTIFEAKKENKKIEIYSLDIKNTQTGFYQLFDNFKLSEDISFFKKPSSEINTAKQILYAYFLSFPSAIIGMILGLLSPFINFLIQKIFNIQNESSSDSSLRESFLFDTFIYLAMSFGISLSISDNFILNLFENVSDLLNMILKLFLLSGYLLLFFSF